MLPKLNCPECERVLIKEDEVLTCPSDLLIYTRNYCKKSDFGNFRAPSDIFFNIFKIHFHVFDQIFKRNKEIHDIKKKSYMIAF